MAFKAKANRMFLLCRQVCTELEKRAGMEQLELVAREHALLRSTVQQGNSMAR